MTGPLVIVTGPPGAGKTTVGRLLAAHVPRSVCIESDWFWTTIVNGHLPPWEGAADGQNRAVIRATIAAATRMAGGGYFTVVEGIFGPWYLDLVRDETERAVVTADYLVLRPSLETCLARATGRLGHERTAGHPALTAEGPIRLLWHAFEHLGQYERCVLDNTDLDSGETTGLLMEWLADGGRDLGIS